MTTLKATNRNTTGEKAYEINEDIKKVNARKDYSTINKVLILVDPDELLIYHKEPEFIKQHYTLLFIFKDIHLELLIKDGGKREQLWNPKEILYDTKSIVINETLDVLQILSYDLIICSSPSYEMDLLTAIERTYSSQLASGTFSTAIYSYYSSAYSSKFENLNIFLFNSNRRYTIGEDLKNQINSFWKQVKSKYVSLSRNVQEQLHPHILEKISRTNEKLFNNVCAKVLILDDYPHEFFIGDTCKWLYAIRIQVIEKFPGALITLNWQNTMKYKGANLVTLHSFGQEINFTNYLWNNIDLTQYDLILCKETIAGKLILHIEMNELNLDNSSLYYYVIEPWPDSYIPSSYQWNLKSYLKRKKGNKNLFEESLNSIKRILSYQFANLRVKLEEREWANQWLQDRGVGEVDRVIILPDSASHEEKCLKFDEYIKVLKALIANPKVKVLIFDEKGLGKKYRIYQVLGKDQIQQVIVAEGTTIRETMCLLSSKYVNAIIGPCTGLLHLANGIYSYFKKEGIMEEQELPVLIAYVGKQMPDYSAWNWWARTIVICLVHRGDNENKVLKKLYECPRDHPNFQKDLLSASEISGDLLVKHLRENAKHKLFL